MEVKFKKKKYKPNARKKKGEESCPGPRGKNIWQSVVWSCYMSSPILNHPIIITIWVGNCGSGHVV